MRKLTGLIAGLGVAALVATSTHAVAAPAPASSARPKAAFGQATLSKFASLPASTFVPHSEPSGAALGTAPINGIAVPFNDQPVQGFSGIVRNGDGTFHVLTDNGYGTKANSADFLLRINHIAPNFDDGSVDVLGGFNLSDPNHHIAFPLQRADRIITGFDLDPESIIRANDGTYWIGDEFGPFLLHFSEKGELLAPPVPLSGVFSPENPDRGSTPPNLGASKGLEGLALAPNGRKAYALLEGTVTGDTAGDLRLNEFDVRRGRYTGTKWMYRLDSPKHAIGDIVAVDKHRFLIIERDTAQGDAAKVKKVYLADKRDRNEDGIMDKIPVADLLNIANPDQVGGFGDPFTFPFFTIENLVILDDHTIGVLNDNNFPSSAGRTPGKPDNNEFIALTLTHELGVDPRLLD